MCVSLSELLEELLFSVSDLKYKAIVTLCQPSLISTSIIPERGLSSGSKTHCRIDKNYSQPLQLWSSAVDEAAKSSPISVCATFTAFSILQFYMHEYFQISFPKKITKQKLG